MVEATASTSNDSAIGRVWWTLRLVFGLVPRDGSAPVPLHGAPDVSAGSIPEVVAGPQVELRANVTLLCRCSPERECPAGVSAMAIPTEGKSVAESKLGVRITAVSQLRKSLRRLHAYLRSAAQRPAHQRPGAGETVGRRLDVDPRSDGTVDHASAPGSAAWAG